MHQPSRIPPRAFSIFVVALVITCSAAAQEASSPVASATTMATATAAAAAAAAAAATPATDPAQVGETRPGSGCLKGYLAAAELPDSLALLPPPPAAGSPAQAADDAAFEAQRGLREGARGKLAQQDANLKFPPAAAAFSCALGIRVSEVSTPHLNMLLRRTLADAGTATYKAKNRYQRTRPFVVFKTASCTPDQEAALAKDGSYPSGHAALGWAWALVLTEVAPDRSDALLQRGHAFGQSRGICGVHWQSDIEAGRIVGAATVARLHANPVFGAQLAAAREEVQAARARPAQLSADCAAEAEMQLSAAARREPA